MTTLGHGHLMIPLEPLPGEKVLWQGQAAATTTFVRAVQLLGAVAGAIGFYAVLLVGFSLLFPVRDKDSATPTPVEACQPACPRAQGDATPVAKAHWDPGRVAMGLGLLSLLPLTALGLAHLQTRNARYLVTSERICVQTGALTHSLCVIDLDKILSVQVGNSWLERAFGLQSIRFVHAGGEDAARNRFRWFLGDPYAMSCMRVDPALVGNLLNHWLPRDDRARGVAA